jgi:hypothetical protein
MRGVLTFVFGLVGGVAAGLAAPQVDFDFSVGASPAIPSGSIVQWVDRTHKGDRLDGGVTKVGREPSVPPKGQRIMEGCDPAVSPLSPAAGNVAGRCAA